MVKRIGVSLLLLVLACLLGGLYGALHNQVSYTVSPAYFHVIKFDQFGIPEGFRNRFGAACVGFWASWWMGAMIGGAFVATGFAVLRGDAFAGGVLRAFGVAAGTAALVGAAMLAAGYVFVPSQPGSMHTIFAKGRYVDDPGALYRALLLHGASYWGGGFGAAAGCITILWRGWRLRRT